MNRPYPKTKALEGGDVPASIAGAIAKCEESSLTDSQHERLEYLRRLHTTPSSAHEDPTSPVALANSEFISVLVERWVRQGGNALDDIVPSGRWIGSDKALSTTLPSHYEEFLANLFAQSLERVSPTLAVLSGVKIGDESDVAAALHKGSKRPVLTLGLPFLDAIRHDPQNQLGNKIRCAMDLLKPLVIFDLRAMPSERASSACSAVEVFSDTDVLLLRDTSDEFGATAWYKTVLHEQAPILHRDEKMARWNTVLSTYKIEFSTDLLTSVVDAFDCSFHQMGEIAHALSRPGNEKLTEREFLEVARRKSRSALDLFARRIEPRARFSDLVLTPHVAAQFVEAHRYVSTLRACREDMGFDAKHSRGRGVHVLFQGPSGTGKTMAAEVLANELGVNLYCVDLSRIVSKYIGETEKNLRQIFEAARSAEGILLFDEGDALFGKRGDVTDSTDRYANMEVNALLQELENYDGVTILTTNLSETMDTAFERRFQFNLKFTKPSQGTRAEIIRKNIPSKMELSEDVKVEDLARFDLTGGNIHAVVRMAAAYAAYDQTPATQLHFLKSIRREYERMNYPITKELFGETHWKEIAPEWDDQRYRKQPDLLRLKK